MVEGENTVLVSSEDTSAPTVRENLELACPVISSAGGAESEFPSENCESRLEIWKQKTGTEWEYTANILVFYIVCRLYVRYA